jgi:hypothetical protein
MKRIIQETIEESGSIYQNIVEVKSIMFPSEFKQLEFSSVWTGAKNSEEPQKKYSILLNKEGIQNLKELLNSIG